MTRWLWLLLSGVWLSGCATTGSRDFYLHDRVLRTHFHSGACAHFEGYDPETNAAEFHGQSRQGFELSVVGAVEGGYLYAINRGNSYHYTNALHGHGYIDEELEDLYRALLRFEEGAGANLSGVDREHFSEALQIVAAFVDRGRRSHPEEGPFRP